eukprot:10851889-Prorocentrum_lima.AAC.1
MTSSLVGSEMCIRDRGNTSITIQNNSESLPAGVVAGNCRYESCRGPRTSCLLYTSDAADDM